MRQHLITALIIVAAAGCVLAGVLAVRHPGYGFPLLAVVLIVVGVASYALHRRMPG